MCVTVLVFKCLPNFPQFLLVVIEVGGEPQFCQMGLLLSPKFCVTLTSWLASAEFLAIVFLLIFQCHVDVLLGVDCVNWMCCLDG